MTSETRVITYTACASILFRQRRVTLEAVQEGQSDCSIKFLRCDRCNYNLAFVFDLREMYSSQLTALLPA